MILVTVGTDMPFDRLVRVVDEWAAATGRTDIFAQIGETDFKPPHIPHAKFLEPAEFRRQFAAATTIVSHAGMGTILTALQWQKPILVMPRRASMGEQRNEHQLATARRLAQLNRIAVAMDESELRAQLDQLSDLRAREGISAHASSSLITSLRDFIQQR